MSHHSFKFSLCAYWDDLESETTTRILNDNISATNTDEITFYYITENGVGPHPNLDEIEIRLNKISSIANNLRTKGINTNIALLPSLSWGQIKHEGPFQKIVGKDGGVSGTGSCPNDANLQNYLKRVIQLLVKAGFSTISIEDDFQLMHHRPTRDGCYCCNCLNLFSKQVNQYYSHTSLIKNLDNNPALKKNGKVLKSTP